MFQQAQRYKSLFVHTENEKSYCHSKAITNRNDKKRERNVALRPSLIPHPSSPSTTQALSYRESPIVYGLPPLCSVFLADGM